MPQFGQLEVLPPANSAKVWLGARAFALTSGDGDRQVVTHIQGLDDKYESTRH